MSWEALHPKAKEFLFTEETLQQLAEDNAAYAVVLIDGDDLTAWHNSPKWRAKSQKSERGSGTIFNARQKSTAIMAMTVKSTVAGANGQEVTRTMQNKELRIPPLDLEPYIDALIDAQAGVCASTGIKLAFQGDGDDPELLCSLDRIDSDGHYDAGNLQVVCRFVSRRKDDSKGDGFRRLIGLVRSTSF